MASSRTPSTPAISHANSVPDPLLAATLLLNDASQRKDELSKSIGNFPNRLPTIEQIQLAQDAIFDRLQRVQAQKHELTHLLQKLKESYENEDLDEVTDDDESGFSSDDSTLDTE